MRLRFNWPIADICVILVDMTDLQKRQQRREVMRASMKPSPYFSGGADFMKNWHKIINDGAKQEEQWIAELQACGVVSAHPNDGWVNREKNTFHLDYPQFNDGVEVGSLVCLGDHFEQDKNHIVKVTEVIERWSGHMDYAFEDYTP